MWWLRNSWDPVAMRTTAPIEKRSSHTWLFKFYAEATCISGSTRAVLAKSLSSSLQILPHTDSPLDP